MRNLEIKCRYPDHRRAARLAVHKVGARAAGRLVQTDTYFATARGRLKLRHILTYPPGRRTGAVSRYELISYDRPNRPEARTSTYHIVPVPDGALLRRALEETLGMRVRVRKSRRLYLSEHLRIHLDTVFGLGKFLEFELIVTPEHPLAVCRREMQRLLAIFAITPDLLVAGSYSDLLAPG